jgi:hypothetical protein
VYSSSTPEYQFDLSINEEQTAIGQTSKVNLTVIEG